MPRATKGTHWKIAALAVLLLVGSMWSFNLATYNWFAADFHDQYSHLYAVRGNIFSVLALALFAGSLLAVLGIVRSRKKRRATQD